MAEAAQVAPAQPAPAKALAQLEMTPFERGAGTALGAAALVAGLFLLYRERRGRNLGPSAWRIPTAALVAAVGGLIVWGSWLEPAAEPKRFVAVWCSAALGMAIAALVATADMMVVRRRGLAERRALRDQSKAELLASVPPRRSALDGWRNPSSN